ncbi:hypothetical protein [Amycolatopsis orientalis]|uniref:hypothetical protein n=1 Tax=Amycolatopsis orientalis TaxID=31958 RepID=UPI0003A0E27A|nr:hypothetical protein [Amycolatopsis orientalis]
MAEKDDNTPKPAEVNPDEFTGLTDDERRKRGRAPDPVLPGQDAPKATPPLEVHAAFALAILATVIIVVGQVVLVAVKQQFADAIMKQQQPGHSITLEQAQSTANFFVWAMLIGALCFGGLLVLFAWKAREGTRSARTIATLLAVLGIVFELGIPRNIYALASSLALVAMLILLYLPKVRDYFPKVGKKL